VGGAVDALVIATPPSTHLSSALQGLRAGKHVPVEKPMTTSTAMAQEGRRRIEESLSWDRQQVPYVRLYDNLLGGSDRPSATRVPA
jgi:Oxidoreductase family, NAD-binding Rossmann fold